MLICTVKSLKLARFIARAAFRFCPSRRDLKHRFMATQIASGRCRFRCRRQLQDNAGLRRLHKGIDSFRTTIKDRLRSWRKACRIAGIAKRQPLGDLMG